MRRSLIAPLLSALLLLACQPAGPGAEGLATDTIVVTPLASTGTAAEAPAAAAPTTPKPKPRPDVLTQDAAPEETSEAVAPEAPETPQQLLCQKAKGQWLSAGDTGAFYCASLTRDSGKQCRKKGDCQGQCLARSGTCSPITPLYGCNDVLEKDGRQVTLCID